MKRFEVQKEVSETASTTSLGAPKIDRYKQKLSSGALMHILQHLKAMLGVKIGKKVPGSGEFHNV